jgi:hypothetical protein
MNLTFETNAGSEGNAVEMQRVPIAWTDCIWTPKVAQAARITRARPLSIEAFKKYSSGEPNNRSQDILTKPNSRQAMNGKARICKNIQSNGVFWLSASGKYLLLKCLFALALPMTLHSENAKGGLEQEPSV